MFKDAIASLYFDNVTVIEQARTKNPITKQTEMTEHTTYSNLPCRLIYKAINATTAREGASVIDQEPELILSPDYDIEAGSKLVVTRQGKTVAYKSSGLPALYPTHQEIKLKPFEGWA